MCYNQHRFTKKPGNCASGARAHSVQTVHICAGLGRGLEGGSSFEVPVGVAQAVLAPSERLPALLLDASLAPAGSGIASSVASVSSAGGGTATSC